MIRGPGATLSGANAVINITSKDSHDTQGWLVSTRASNDNSDLSLRYGGKISEDTTYRAYLKARYNDEFHNAGGDDVGDQWSLLRGGFRIDRHSSDNDTFTFQGDIGGNKISEPFNLPIPTPPVHQLINDNRTNAIGNLLARWNYRLNDESDFTLQMYYEHLRVDRIATDYDQNTADLDFQHRFKAGERHEITWGLGYRFMSSHIKETGWLLGNPTDAE